LLHSSPSAETQGIQKSGLRNTTRLIAVYYNLIAMIFRKILLILVLVFLIFLASLRNANASLISIDKEGRIVINVLSAEKSVGLEIPQSEYLEIKNILSETPDSNAKISLVKNEGKTTLNVTSSSGNKSLDITNYKDEILVVEERPEVQKLTFFVSGDKFTLVQRGVYAETDYQINIDPISAKLTLEAPSGLRYLSVLPHQATDVVLKANFINRIDDEKRLTIKEEGSELTYEVFGDKVFNIFNLFEYGVPVSAKVSASTGEILSIEGPTWLKVINFLFV
jgi:hypothetical protein